MTHSSQNKTNNHIPPRRLREQKGKDMIQKNIRRYKLMEIHMNMVKSGQYDVARLILKLIRQGEIHLGLRNTDFAVEVALENAGVHITYSRGYSSAYAHL